MLILSACAGALLWADHPAVLAQASTQATPQVHPAAQQTEQPSPHTYDATARSKAILAHLNAVLRLYRDSTAPIQKLGEPSDVVYRDQSVALAAQAADFAFQSAKAEAALIDQFSHQSSPSAVGTQTQKLQAARSRVEQQIAALKTQDAALAKQLASAPVKRQAVLQQQREQVEGEMDLQTAMDDALGRIAGMAAASDNTGFAAQVSQLERSAPGLTSSKAIPSAPTLENLSAARNAGVASQAISLFHLLNTREAIDNLIKEADHLHQQALDLRTPLVSLLKNTITQGQALSQVAPTAAPAKGKAGAATTTNSSATRDTFDHLTATFKAISGATVPLSQETLTLEQTRASLQVWRSAVNEEYVSILRSLMLRVAAIAIALLVIFILSEVWQRATKRYVRDMRRRRQLLLIRRLITGFLSGLVLIFGLVTQFSSLATFAGFITAGIAVGLQTILLSVAAYFFIVGRYGVKVGDRITIAGVTGDVVEVGLVRFYIMELAGSGTDLYPTGRVAVFSNAVLFQAGTPLYKQMPGTEYAWHELTVKLSPAADYRPAVQQILGSLQNVYNGYSGHIEQQHRNLESWIDSSLDAPGIQSSLQLVDGGLQFWARFPVIIRQAAAIDEKMTESLLELMANNENVKAIVSTPPVIKAAVKG